MTNRPDTPARPQLPPRRGPIRAHLVNAWRFTVLSIAWNLVRTIIWFRSRLQITRWLGGNRREVAVRLWTIAWLTGVWVLLWGTVNPANILAGIGVALVVLIVLPLPRVPVEGRIHPLSVLRIVVQLFVDLVKSSVQVGWLALRPSKPPLSAVLRVRMAIKSDMVLTLAVDYMNLIPGTMVVEIDHSRRLLYVHLIDASSPDKVKAFHKQVTATERMFVQAFERDSEWHASPYHGIDDDYSIGVTT